MSALVALGTAAGPASAADGFSLRLSGPAAAVVGQPLSLTASGANPSVADYSWPTYLDVELFRPGVVSVCPASESAASGLATSTGGALLAWDVQMDLDADGNFSIPVGLTPQVTGSVLLCGYTAGLAGETLASASFTLPVSAAGSTTAGPSAPHSITPPRLRRAGNRVLCDAGQWSNNPTRFSYGWLVDGHAQRRAGGRTLALTPRLRGHRVQCRVTASNSTGRATAFSNRLAVR